MSEILFYHLTESTLEQALPGLVEKSLARGWKVVIQTGIAERLDVLDQLLWTWREDSFVPHGSIRDGKEHLQPVWLTNEEDRPNEASIRFLVEGAQIDDPGDYARIVYMFDGHNEASVEHARSRWKFHKDQSEHDQTYWKQSSSGGWEKMA